MRKPPFHIFWIYYSLFEDAAQTENTSFEKDEIEKFAEDEIEEFTAGGDEEPRGRKTLLFRYIENRRG